MNDFFKSRCNPLLFRRIWIDQAILPELIRSKWIYAFSIFHGGFLSRAFDQAAQTQCHFVKMVFCFFQSTCFQATIARDESLPKGFKMMSASSLYSFAGGF